MQIFCEEKSRKLQKIAEKSRNMQKKQKIAEKPECRACARRRGRSICNAVVQRRTTLQITYIFKVWRGLVAVVHFLGRHGAPGVPDGEGGIVHERIDDAGVGTDDVVFEKRLFLGPKQVHVRRHIVGTVFEAPDGIIIAFFLEFSGEETAAPNAFAKRTEVLVSHGVIVESVEEQYRAGSGLEFGCTFEADDAAGEAQNAFELEVRRKVVSRWSLVVSRWSLVVRRWYLVVCDGIGGGEGDDGSGGTARHDEVMDIDVQFGVLREKSNRRKDVFHSQFLGLIKLVHGLGNSGQSFTHFIVLHSEAVVDSYNGITVVIEGFEPLELVVGVAGTGLKSATENV